MAAALDFPHNFEGPVEDHVNMGCRRALLIDFASLPHWDCVACNNQPLQPLGIDAFKQAYLPQEIQFFLQVRKE